jgi:iron complex outermembrane receptor protein
MSPLFKRTPLALAVLSLPMALLSAAQAQTLDEVVVSASRAQARSFDAPAAIQSVGRETIQNGGPQVNLSESLVRVPGLTILDRSNYAQDLQLSIRGFGARAAFGIRGIRLLIDGIPATTPDGQGQGSSVSLTSMDRIEVLRGPLAQLYGNASGGVIQAFTKPASKVPLADYQYYVGDYGLHRADYQFSDTVGDYGLVADYSTFSIDGYRDNSRTERKQFNGKLDFNTNEQTRVNLVFNQFDMPLAQDPLGLTAAQLKANPAGAGTDAVTNKARKIVLQNQLGGSATYTVDRDHAYTGRAYYGTRENLQYQSNGRWIGLNRDYYGAGLQYNAKTNWADVPVQYAAGYEFDRSSERRQAGLSPAGTKTAGVLSRDEDNLAENSDVFFQATAQVSEQLAVVGGLRASTVRFVSDDKFTTDGFDGSGNASYSATNPVLGFTYFANDHLNLYANYGQGFESPTLAEVAYQGSKAPVLAQFNPDLKASSSQHYELGAKWVPQRGSRVDFSVFQIQSTDEIVVAASTSGQTSYKNAPGTSRTGFELAGNTLITPHVGATMSASMLEAQYSQAFTSGTTPIATGNKIPGIPQTSFFSELAWTSAAVQPGAKTRAAGTRLAAEVVHSGRVYANDQNTASADGRTVINLSASQRWAVDKAAVTLYARLNNASDERYVGSVIVNQSSQQFFEPGLPRNWLLGVSVSAPL